MPDGSQATCKLSLLLHSWTCVKAVAYVMWQLIWAKAARLPSKETSTSGGPRLTSSNRSQLPSLTALVSSPSM